MKSKNLIYALLITVIAIFTSCEKEDANSLKDQECSNILYFENLNQFNDEVQKVLSLSTEEKINWAQKEGFNSFGVASETFYEKIICAGNVYRIDPGIFTIQNNSKKNRKSNTNSGCKHFL